MITREKVCVLNILFGEHDRLISYRVSLRTYKDDRNVRIIMALNHAETSKNGPMITLSYADAEKILGAKITEVEALIREHGGEISDEVQP